MEAAGVGVAAFISLAVPVTLYHHLCIVAAFGQLQIRKHFGLEPKRLWPFRRNIGTNRCFWQEQNVIAALISSR
jgi:hypothetical protein